METTNEILSEIADELHNMNRNICDLINVLKEKPSMNVTTNDESLDALIEAMTIHKNQLDEAKHNAEIREAAEAEYEYQKKQANFDQALKKLGIM